MRQYSPNSSQQLFNRSWSLTIGKPTAGAVKSSNSGLGVALGGGNAKTYASSPTSTIPFSQNPTGGLQSVLTTAGQPPTGLRVVFDIDKGSVSSPNKATVKVYNFSSLSRLNYQSGYQLQLQAGYVGGLMSTIYIGDIPSGPKGALSERKGAEIITTFECGTAEKQLIYGHYDQSYPPGTRVVQIVQDIANQFGLTVSSATVVGLQDLVFNSCYVCSGSLKKNMDQLLSDQNLEWHINDGYLSILPIGTASTNFAILLSSGANGAQPFFVSPAIANFSDENTGLIGVPSQGDGFITFDALINPRLVPGALVQIISRSINGFYKIRRSHFQGDSHGDKWMVTCEGTITSAIEVNQQNINGKFVV